jgi:hypothetical protein
VVDVRGVGFDMSDNRSDGDRCNKKGHKTRELSQQDAQLHMMPLLPTMFHKILFSSFRGGVLTSCFRSIFREMSKFKGA